MSRPFDYIDNKKIDLTIQEHRDVVIKRNKELQQRLKEGIYIFDDSKIKASIIVRIELLCFVCGTQIEEDSKENLDDFDLSNKNFPTLKCDCCKTK